MAYCLGKELFQIANVMIMRWNQHLKSTGFFKGAINPPMIFVNKGYTFALRNWRVLSEIHTFYKKIRSRLSTENFLAWFWVLKVS